MAGNLITFEGIDGCGKSTQAQLLFEKLKQTSVECILTREPGGSAGAEEIRNLLVTGTRNRWSAETETLLFTAARRDHIEKIIIPSIKANQIVISDRFFDSTRIYQGSGQIDLSNLVDKLHRLVIKLTPNLTFIIDMDPKQALKRGLDRSSGEDRFEDFGLKFQTKMRDGFVKLAEQEKSRCHLIKGDDDPNVIAKEIFKIYLNHDNE